MRIYISEAFKSENPIPFASVRGLDVDDNLVIGVSASSAGVAEFNTSSWKMQGVEYLEISSVGYNKARFNINELYENENIGLSKNEIGLGEVVIESVKGGNWKLILMILLIVSTVILVIYAATKGSK